MQYYRRVKCGKDNTNYYKIRGQFHRQCLNHELRGVMANKISKNVEGIRICTKLVKLLCESNNCL